MKVEETWCVISLVVVAVLIATVDTSTLGVLYPDTESNNIVEKYEVQGGFWHVISRGETLNGIVKKYKKRSVWVRLDQVMLWNGRWDADHIYPGEWIWIPYLEWQPHEGVASWYGPRFHGRRMANGKKFNQWDRKTIAHPYLPKDMKVIVVNKDNGKWTEAFVEDRGPYTTDGRILDVSKKIAQVLGFEKTGLANVKVFPLG